MIRSPRAIVGIVSLAAMALGTFDANAVQPADVAGVWLSPKANMRVRIGACGSALCGNIVWLKSATDPQTGQPLTDRNNPDPVNRTKPLVGAQMVIGLKPGGGAGEWSGQVYTPNDGKIRDASFWMDGPDALRIEVCALGRLLCHTQTWTRTN